MTWASSGLTIWINCILPFPFPVSGDPAFGHFHLHPPARGWALNFLNALRLGVESKLCGPYSSSYFLSLCTSKEFKIRINCYHFKWWFEYVQVLLKIQHVWQVGIFILLSNGWHLLSMSLFCTSFCYVLITEDKVSVYVSFYARFTLLI